MRNSINKDNRGISVVGVILIIALIVIAIVLFIIFKGGLFGKGDNIGSDGVDNIQAVTSQEDPEDEETNTVNENIETEVQDDSSDTYKGAIIKISVIGNDYIYDSEKITIEKFLEIVKATEGDYIVKIKDEDASLNAYNSLIKKLDENNIGYTEE